MFARYLKAQFMVLLCGGLVGPIFLAVYFALGPMARPAINWMFWAGLFATAIDVLAALALANYGAKSAARHQQLTRSGVLVPVRITGISDTSWFVNDQQMIKVGLHFEAPTPFDAQATMAASPVRMQILNAHKLVALVEPGTQNYEIDWEASALIAGAVPAEFTLDDDNRTYDLTGQAGPLMQILQVLHANQIPIAGSIDIRSNPVVRQQVMDIVRRAATHHTAPASAAPSTFVPASPPPTVSQRLQQLDLLRATGAITEAEYSAKRQEILAEL